MPPRKFSRFIIAVHGDEGKEWLEKLPGIIAACERVWSLHVEPPLENLSYNYIAPVILVNGEKAILKIGIPNSELTTEIAALRSFDGRGCVRILEANNDLGAILLEWLRPGTQLLNISDDDEATRIAARVMNQLWRPAPDEYPFPAVARWSQGLARMRQQLSGGTGPLPVDLVEKAEALFDELLDSMETPVLLHGDLHHENILQAERAPWLAIDPKGVVGEPAYEVGALLRNIKAQLLTGQRPSQILDRRVGILAEEFGFEHERMLGWGFAQAVLAAWWCLEDNLDCWEGLIYCAEQIDEVMMNKS